MSFIVATLFSYSSCSFAEDAPFEPWRVNNALELPEWLKISGNHRIRFEHVDGILKGGDAGNDHIVLWRTRLKAEITRGKLDFVVEVVDSRQAEADEQTILTSSMVNTFAIGEAYAGYHYRSVLDDGSDNYIKIGRQGIDLGSRRLVAKNGYRNTANSFTGINNEWQFDSGESITAFYVFPVVRLTNKRDELLDNEYQFDEENFQSNFFGVFAKSPNTLTDLQTELFIFGLIEQDGPDFTTLNRDLLTIGTRIYKEADIGEYDFSIETMLQTGKSRESSAFSDQNDLDHFAYFQHLEIGYTIDDIYETHVSLLFDYASGDEDPDDGKNNRFDSLYGARRWDYGPTSLYSAFARSNIIAAGGRLQYYLNSRITIMVADKFYWLASSTDSWTTTGLRDETGKATSYLGNQLEAKIIWDPLPYSLRFEFGAAYLFTSDYIKEVLQNNLNNPDTVTTNNNVIYSGNKTDQSMFYMQALFTF